MNRLYITDRHINTGTTEHIQTDGNLTLTPNSHQFADKTAQRTFYDTHPLTTGQRRVIHTDGFIRIIEHETETGHLLVGNYGRRLSPRITI